MSSVSYPSLESMRENRWCMTPLISEDCRFMQSSEGGVRLNSFIDCCNFMLVRSLPSGLRAYALLDKRR